MRRLAAIALLFLVAWGCADLVTGPAPSGDLAPRSLGMAPSALALTVGGSGRATATLFDAAGQPVAPAGGRSIEYASSAPGVFTVAGDGTATGVGVGQGTLTARYGAFSVGIPVTVTGGTSRPPIIDLVPAGPLVDTTVAASATSATIGRAVAVANAGEGTLGGLAASVSYANGQPAGWLQNLRLDAATAPTTLRFDLVRGALAVGAYDAVVRVSTPTAGVDPRDLAVRLVVDYNAARIGLSLDTAGATTYTGAPPVRVAVDVTERAGLGEAALGTLSCADLRLASGNGWATVERCADSVVVLLDPRAVDGEVTGTLRVAAANTRDTASLALRLDARRAAIGFVPDSLAGSAVAGGTAVRLAADVVESTGRAGTDVFGTLQCTLAAPDGAPAAAVSACGDSVAVTVTPGAATGTFRYVVDVQAPGASAPVAGRSLPVVVAVAAAPVPPSIVATPAGPFADTTTAASPASTRVARAVAVTNGGTLPLTGLTAEVTYADGEPTGWLQDLRLDGATAPTIVRWDVVRGALPPGSYAATVRLAAPGVAPVNLAVTWTVLPAAQPVLALSPSAVAARLYSSGPTLRRAIAIDEASGAGSAALGTIACDAPVLSGAERWAVVERCGPDSLVVVLDPQGMGDGDLRTGSIRVTAANAREAVTLPLEIAVSTATLGLSPARFAVRVGSYGVQRVRVAGDLFDATGIGSESAFGPLACTVRANPEQPPLTIDACGDSIVASLPVDNTRGNGRATLEYRIDIEAPAAGFFVAGTSTDVVVRLIEVTSLEVVAGDGQSAPAGTTLPVAPRVRLVGDDGLPFAGAPVRFTVSGGGGSLASTEPVTADENGIAVAPAWTLGAIPGTNTLVADYGNREVTITARGTGDGTAVIVLTPPGPVVDTLRLGILDEVARPHAVAVTNGGTAALEGLTATVRYDGETSGWIRDLQLDATTGPTTLRWQTVRGELPAGSYKASVTVASSDAGVAPVELVVELVVAYNSAEIGFSATELDGRGVTNGAPVRVAVDLLELTGVGEEALGPIQCFGFSYGEADPFASVESCGDSIVLLLDPARFDGTATGSLRVTGAFTRDTATLSFRLTAFPARLGLSPNPLTIRATTGGEPLFRFVDILDLSGFVGEANFGPIETIVTEPPGGPPLSVVTAADTLVLMLERNAGQVGRFEYTIRVGAPFAPVPIESATLRIVVELLPSANLAIVAGNGQTAAPGATLPVEPRVRVTDAGGAPIAGAPVSFVVIEGGGVLGARLDSVEVSTDVEGIATAPAWTLGRTVGLNRLRATALSGPQVTFSATAQVPPTPFRASTLHGLCGLDLAGRAHCWGANSTGRLGDGTTIRKNRANPVSSASGSFYLLRGGPGHTCAAGGTDEGYYCWGSGGSGQTGLGTFNNVTLPQRVGLASNIYGRISAGSQTSCAITDDGTANRLFCWGANSRGQLGNGSTGAFTNVPTTEAAIPHPYINDVAVGDNHACALANSGGAYTLYCWGQGWYLGTGIASSTLVQRTPVAVSFPDDLPAGGLSAGFDATCLISFSGSGLYCWGPNGWGATGNGTTSVVTVPTRVSFPGLSSYFARQVVVGERHACAIVAGETWCWGDNQFGQLGRGTLNDAGSTVPVRVQTSVRFSQLSTGLYTTCGLAEADNTVWCWGYGLGGELGNGQDSDNSGVPVQVIGPP